MGKGPFLANNTALFPTFVISLSEREGIFLRLKSCCYAGLQRIWAPWPERPARSQTPLQGDDALPRNF